VPGQLDDRGRQPHDPGDAEQQQHARAECGEQTETAGGGALVLRQTAGHDREQNQIVDAEHDLHGGEGEETGPKLRVGPKLQVGGEIHRAAFQVSEQVFDHGRATSVARAKPRVSRNNRSSWISPGWTTPSAAAT